MLVASNIWEVGAFSVIVYTIHESFEEFIWKIYKVELGVSIVKAVMVSSNRGRGKKDEVRFAFDASIQVLSLNTIIQL